MPREADRVAELSTTTGTGSMTLAGATAGHRTWSAGFGASNVSVHYGIVHDGNGTWESGIGTFLPGSGALQRDLVLASSSGGSKVSFASGSKVVYSQRPAESPQQLRVRRSTDIGLEIIPAASQSAAMLRVEGAGGADALVVNAAGRVTTYGGVAMGSELAAAATDLSRHLALYGTTYGLNATSGRINYVAPTAHDVYVAGALAAQVTAAGVIASLSHKQDGGYFRVGAFSTASYGTGNARFYYSATDRQLYAGSDNAGSVGALALNLNGLWLNGDTNGALTQGRISSHGGIDLTLKTDGTYTIFRDNAGALAGRMDAPGTSAANAATVMTREKGDARYQLAVSSAELKAGIQPLATIDTTGIMPRSWVWNMDGHPRNGLPGAGFIYEELAEAFPEATYPASEGRPGGIDTNAILAAFVGSTRQELAAIFGRLAVLEAAA